MTRLFEELAFRDTPLGELSLRRRRELRLEQDVLEIKLGDEFLMSSLFTASEIALAEQALAWHGGHELAVVVGGLGLGYTAAAALAHPALGSLLVVEYLDAVIDWHRDGLIPLGARLAADPRCRLRAADFFACAASAAGFDAAHPGRRFDAILLDIDHAPGAWLSPAHAPFYRPAGLRACGRHLTPGGVFGLWSNEAPDASFVARLGEAFATATAVPVDFYNPLQERNCRQTVYLARTATQ